MSKCTRKIQYVKEEPETSWSVLEQIAREGARKMLQIALEDEVEEYVQKHRDITDYNYPQKLDKK